MLELFMEYGMFFAKVFTIVIGIVVCVAGVVAVSSKQSSPEKGSIKIKNLNDYYEGLKNSLLEELLDKSALKAHRKSLDKEEKQKKKADKKASKSKDEKAIKPRLFVVDFNGDIKASEAEPLAKEVNSILTIAEEKDEVMVRLESPGGVVHGYGLAASQLKRIKDKNIKLTACVDKVAASGGYMMASVADEIIAAPFAVVGSIGVVAQMPNFNRLLKKHDVDFDVYTAGEFKRTVTMFGENTEEGKKKLNEDLETTHDLFKAMIKESRSDLDIDAVATGEVWYGTQAIDKKLIDAVGTSDDFILSKLDGFDVYKLSYEKKKSISDKLGFGLANILDRVLLKAGKELADIQRG